MKDNPYAAPEAQVADPEPRSAGKPGVGARFLWTLVCAFPVFAGLVLIYGARKAWVVGMVGALMFSAVAGAIAMCIPVKRKVGFIVPGILISFYVAYLVGTRGK